jgi:protein-S-isoprenylcysteine O-methyltransferase Ste14
VTSGITAGGWLSIAFGVAYASWIISEIVGASILPRIRRRDIPEASRADRGSRLAIISSVVVSVAIVFLFAQLRLATFPPVVIWAGIALMLVGIAIRQWAIAVLGKFFSVSVRVLAGHRIVTSGPYRWVRHPSYSGLLLGLVGLAMAGGSWEGLLAVVGLTTLSLGYRIRVEEAFLIRQLGLDYVAYQNRTKRLIPHLI